MRRSTRKIYRVATNDFMARGGDGYTMFVDAPRLLPDPDAPLLANEVMDYIRKLGTVKTGVEGRIVLKYFRNVNFGEMTDGEPQ